MRYWFNILTGGHVVDVIKGDFGFIFITFNSRQAALHAVERGNQMEFGPKRMNVTPISCQYTSSQLEGNQNAQTSGSFLSQVPSSLFVGPLEQLYKITTKQGWGIPQFSVEKSLRPHGQVLYRYSESLPKVSTIAVSGEWDLDRSAALINCVVSTLREITKASLQNKYSDPPPPSNYYRTPPPGPPQSVAKIQSRGKSSIMDPYDLVKLTTSLDQMSMEPILADPRSKKLHKDESHFKNFEI